MYAQVFHGVGRPFERVTVPTVDLRVGEVLVAIELATVCGSDLHTIAGARSAPVPLVLGHEQVGRVIELGPGAPARTVDGVPLTVGARVVWGVAVDCGACRYCAAGLPQKCLSLRKYGHERVTDDWVLSGGFASHAHLLARTPIVVVDEEVPAAVLAPASCATATVMAAIEAAAAIRPVEGAVVAISGCGMLGLTAIAVAAARGAVVIASDPDPARREAALAFGASQTVDGSRVAWRDAPAHQIALELSGAPAAVSGLIGAADIGAVLVLVGSVFPAGTVDLDPEQVVRRMLTVRGVHNYAPRHLLEAVDFLRDADHGAFAALVEPTVPLDAIADALHSRAPRAALLP